MSKNSRSFPFDNLRVRMTHLKESSVLTDPQHNLAVILAFLH